MKSSSALRNIVLGLVTIILTLCAPVLSRAALVATWGNIPYGQNWMPAGVNNVKAIAGGYYHSLALRSDGSMVAWGYGGQGQTNVPPGLVNVKAIAAGYSHNLALKVDGSVVAWGNNSWGQTNVPGDLSRVAAIASGSFHSLALKADGTLIGWGYNPYVNSNGQTNIPAGLSDVIAVAAGWNHSLALKSDGTVVAWGDNSSSQTNTPSSLSNVVAITSQVDFSLALKSDGTVVAWGNNSWGQTNVPASLSNVVAVSAGLYHAIALKSDGTISIWGNNTYGQSVMPGGLSNVSAIAAGGYHSLVLVQEGPVQISQNPQSLAVDYTSNATFSVVATGHPPRNYQWYRNGNVLIDSVRVSGATNATLNISNAQFTDIGTYTVVVNNAFGSVISSGASLTVISPPFITLQPVDRTVRAGSDAFFSAAASGTPTLQYQWNFNGADIPFAIGTTFFLSNAQPTNSGHYSMRVTNLYGAAETIPVTLTVTDSPPYFIQHTYVRNPNQSISTNLVAAAGNNVTIRVDARGSTPLFYQWKFNGLAIPDATNTTLTLSNLQYNQAGYYNAEVNNSFGTTNSAKFFLNVSQVLIAGTPFANNINTPLGLSNVIAVAAGGSHVMALRSDGTVRTWVANANYLTGIFPYSVTNIPVTATNIVAISSGNDHCLALRSNGTVVAWGGYYFEVTNVPVNLSNVVGIAAGGNRSYAVKTDGTVTGWGQSATVPTGLSNIVAVAAGASQNLALRRDGTVVMWPGSGSPFSIVSGLSNAIAIATSSTANRALRQDGTVVTWPRSSTSQPVLVTDNRLVVSNAVALALGSTSASMILKQDGTLVTSELDKTSLPATNSNISAIAAGGVQSGFGVMVVGNGSPNITLHPYSQIVQRSNTVRLHSRAAGVQPMRYQWLVDNLPLPGATNSSLILSNVLGKNTGAYRMIASNVLGTVASQIARLSIPFNTNLAAALNTNDWQWFEFGSGGGRIPSTWFAQNRETHDGDVAAQSGAIANNSQSSLQTSINGAGKLTFWWKVSSEEGFDFLHFYLDNTATPLVSISGEADWEQKTFAIPPGAHTLRWTYAKDVSVSAGRDAGWVDEVVFTPDPPVMERHPYSQTVAMGANVTIPASANSSAPMTFQWLKNGTNLTGATAQYLTLTNVTRRDSATYALRVSNAGGSVMSSNAVLKVIVRQRMGSIHRATDGSLEMTSRDADGGELFQSDLALFEAQSSTNLIHWQTLPDALSVTNGSLLLRDVDANHLPQRFYRVVEH